MQYSNQKSTITELNTKIENQKKDIIFYSSQVSALKSEKESLQSNVDQLNSDIEQLNSE